MALIDMSLAELREYRPERSEPTDFDQFWAATIEAARSHPIALEHTTVDNGLPLIAVDDVTFAGYGGQPIKAWLVRPAQAAGPLPCVIEYCGYGGGRGLPHEQLYWAAAGYAHLLMDTRGQGGGWRVGATPDDGNEGAGPSVDGFMTKGIQSPETYYYRRLFTDAVRAVEAARAHPAVDGSRVFVKGGSQGAGMAIAVAGLVPDLSGVVADVAFLQHYRRATEITDSYPYRQITDFLATQRTEVDNVFRTLSYFDGVNFAARANAPALYSVALMDDVSPPSTVFASYNHYAGPKEIVVYPYNGHDGGGPFCDPTAREFLAKLSS
ncbi:MAG TPA: acetylxylan esterase [Actinospica sp.]|jgi:cephalosporin-C deacetylase|nr:acetylxylan esterase [Actinospica sp.]